MKKILILTLLLILTISCSSQKKMQVSREFIFPDDRDTFLIKPNIENPTNNDTLIFYLHGSGGPNKWSASEASNLAKAGFRVVHLCWFNCNKQYTDDLDAIEEVNLKVIALKITKAAQFLKNKKIILVGISRGAELVALLICNQQLFDIEITKAVILSGIDVTANARKVIPRAILTDRLMHPNHDNLDPYLSLKSAWVIDDLKIPNRSDIHVENFKKPLMIIHGELDKLWSVKGAYKVKENYEKNGKQAFFKIMPDKGHVFPSGESDAFKALVQFLSNS